MQKQTTPTKYTGTLNWAFLKDHQQAQIGRAIARSDHEIIIDFKADGHTYSLKLRRQSGNTFAGNYTWRIGADSGTGFASAECYRSQKSGLLDEVDHFADEAH